MDLPVTTAVAFRSHGSAAKGISRSVPAEPVKRASKDKGTMEGVRKKGAP